MVNSMKLSSEHKKYKFVLIQYLEEKESEFLNEWNETIKINEIDPYKEKIKENGYGMYSLVIQTFKEVLSEDLLIKLAYQVAKERLEANINIGDFLYNINLGRNIIIRNLLGQISRLIICRNSLMTSTCTLIRSVTMQ